jgi:hypothetical protein
MMHRCRRQSAETEYTPLVVWVDEAPDRGSLKQRVALRRRGSQRPTQLLRVYRLAFSKLPVQRDRHSLFLGRERLQVRLQISPVFV